MQLSIIIPVKNGSLTLGRCLHAITTQTITESREIIVLDSMSTDNSVSIAKSFGAKIIAVPNGTFNHGLTRNVGVQYASGELIYFTVQDAWLSETGQLEKMCAHFEDPEVQSVTGIQGIPATLDANPAMWFKRVTAATPEVRQWQHDKLLRLSPKQRLALCDWDNVNAMYRKCALQALPFKETDFAEDALWAEAALLKGWTIVRDSSLLVYHYHHQTFSYAFRTAYVINYMFWKNFNIWPVLPPVIIPFFRNVYTLFKRSELTFTAKLKWISHNLSRLLSLFFATAIFKSAYLLGKEKLLKKSYQFFCPTVPQGLQKKRMKKGVLMTILE